MGKLYKELLPYDHIIFDWNGTLLSDGEHVWNSLMGALQTFERPQFSYEEFRERFFFPVRDFYQTLGVPLEYYDNFNKEYHKRYFDGYQKMELFSGTHELLGQLKKEKKDLCVLSASEEEHLHEAVDFFGIKGHMVEVFGLSNLGAVGKADRGKELMEHLDPCRHKTVIVGDTLYDAEVGKALGIDTLLVADGIQSYAQLKKGTDSKVLFSRY